MKRQVNNSANAALKELQTMPGVGPKVAVDLYDLGYRNVANLAGADPEAMYRRICANGHVDRCMLYVFRCVVYYAGRRKHDPELLKWWNWSDEKCRAR